MRDQAAVSPVIGTLLILAIFAVVSAIVISVGRPALIEYQEKGQFDAAVGQMGLLASDIRQLTVSGEANEVRQPTVALPGGTLETDDGHWVAVSIGYVNSSYGSAQGTTVTPGAHHWLTIEAADGTLGLPDLRPEWDRRDSAFQLHYRNSDYGGGLDSFSGHGLLYQWDGDDWTGETEVFSRTFSDDTYHPVQLPVGELIGDGPWRLDVWRATGLVTPVDVELVGQVFLIKQPRMTYAFSGETGPKYAHVENGAVFREDHARFTLEAPGLLAAPDNSLGNTVLTVRAAALDIEGGAGGETKASVLMKVRSSNPYVYNAGAAITHLQLSGPYPDIWYAHLVGRGFTTAADPVDGVYYAQVDTQGNYGAYPVNVMVTDLTVQVRTA